MNDSLRGASSALLSQWIEQWINPTIERGNSKVTFSSGDERLLLEFNNALLPLIRNGIFYELNIMSFIHYCTNEEGFVTYINNVCPFINDLLYFDYVVFLKPT